MLEDLIDNLKTYAYYKELIITDQTKGWNILIEAKDGEYKVVPQSWLADKWFDRWAEIKRITIFFKVKPERGSLKKVQWREYEFVAAESEI